MAALLHYPLHAGERQFLVGAGGVGHFAPWRCNSLHVKISRSKGMGDFNTSVSDSLSSAHKRFFLPASSRCYCRAEHLAFETEAGVAFGPRRHHTIPSILELETLPAPLSSPKLAEMDEPSGGSRKRARPGRALKLALDSFSQNGQGRDRAFSLGL